MANAGQVDVELVALPAWWPAGVERIEICSGGRPVGDVDFRACADCRVAVLEQVRVDPPYRRRGWATRAVQAAVASRPGYRWATSALHDTVEARAFWAALGWPEEDLGVPVWCAHMYEADGQLS